MTEPVGTRVVTTTSLGEGLFGCSVPSGTEGIVTGVHDGLFSVSYSVAFENDERMDDIPADALLSLASLAA